MSNSNIDTTEKNKEMTTSQIQDEDKESENAGEDKVLYSTTRTKFDRSRTLPVVDEVLNERESEISTVIALVGQDDNNQDSKVISVGC
jgi:hypothetical protein